MQTNLSCRVLRNNFDSRLLCDVAESYEVLNYFALGSRQIIWRCSKLNRLNEWQITGWFSSNGTLNASVHDTHLASCLLTSCRYSLNTNCLSSVACPALQYFSTLSLKRHDFREKKLLKKKCMFWFSVQLLFETFLILRRTQRDIIVNIIKSSCKVPLSMSDFNGNWIC